MGGAEGFGAGTGWLVAEVEPEWDAEGPGGDSDQGRDEEEGGEKQGGR